MLKRTSAARKLETSPTEQTSLKSKYKGRPRAFWPFTEYWYKTFCVRIIHAHLGKTLYLTNRKKIFASIDYVKDDIFNEAQQTE